MSARAPWGRLPDHLASLYPTTPPSHLRRGWIVAGYTVALPVIAIVSLLRQSGISPLASIWAEDGEVFLQQAASHSFAWTLVHPYAGYSQLWPRLAAELAILLPLRDAAAVLSIGGALMVAALALLVFHAARAHIRSRTLRALLSASMILLPVAGAELLNNAVNIPWWLLFATFWMLLWRPRTFAGAVLAGIVCFLATASQVVTVVLLPLVLLRVIGLRTFRDQLATIGFLVGVACQVVMILLNGGAGGFAGATFHDVAQAFALHVGLGWIAGSRLSSHLITSSPQGAMALGVTLFLVVAILSMLQRDRELRSFAAVALAYSVVAFAVPVWLRGVGPAMVDSITNGGRYSATPVLLVVATLLMSADRFWRRAPVGTSLRPVALRLATPLVCCAILAPCWVIDLRDSNPRSTELSWTVQVATAQQDCRSSSAASYYGFQTAPPGWGVALSCRFIDTH